MAGPESRAAVTAVRPDPGEGSAKPLPERYRGNARVSVPVVCRNCDRRPDENRGYAGNGAGPSPTNLGAATATRFLPCAFARYSA
jgi:hypothetical protein